MFDPKDFIDMEVDGNAHEFGVGTDPYRSSQKKLSAKSKQ
jgi:hypothetical protein